ncbi:ciliary-associated calcium-binding coiled-coil protein 1 isoform X3 [Tamandua tetradactyla]|uniref:ciliary-associated calcium-binding coiled-coil protein 1 isoform X3 n=1 Tax=Tamandua tetradactyla TaxID=48850 RepID=UPI004054810C
MITTPIVQKEDAEPQEHEKILSLDCLSYAQISELLEEDVDGVQKHQKLNPGLQRGRKLEEFLNFKSLQTCLKEAILLDYYVSGFLWARDMEFSIIQYSKFMTLLHMLLHNLRTLHMSLEDSIKWLGEVMAEIGPSHSENNEEWHIFDVKQANAIIDYLKISLFQHYKLYEFLFYSTREEIIIGTEQVIEVITPTDDPFPEPLEEGIAFDIYSTFIVPHPTLDSEMKGVDQEQGSDEAQTEIYTADTDPLVGFTIEDVKSVMEQVTDDIVSIQEIDSSCGLLMEEHPQTFIQKQLGQFAVFGRKIGGVKEKQNQNEFYVWARGRIGSQNVQTGRHCDQSPRRLLSRMRPRKVHFRDWPQLPGALTWLGLQPNTRFPQTSLSCNTHLPLQFAQKRAQGREAIRFFS